MLPAATPIRRPSRDRRRRTDLIPFAPFDRDGKRRLFREQTGRVVLDASRSPLRSAAAKAAA